mgnify:CR=1 FL=1
MAEPKNEDFLDDIATAEAEELADEFAEISEEALELDELRAERDDYSVVGGASYLRRLRSSSIRQTSGSTSSTSIRNRLRRSATYSAVSCWSARICAYSSEAR